jgi:predicted RNase H-like HicB family nuclease
MAQGGSLVKVEVDRETDGRWTAEVPALPGALAYGATRQEAVAKAQALALRVLAERLENGEPTPELNGLFAAA